MRPVSPPMQTGMRTVVVRNGLVVGDAVKVGLEPLHELEVVQRPGLGQARNLNALREGGPQKAWVSHTHQ